MKAISNHMLIPRNHIARIAIGTLAILAVPLVAMQFSADVNWNLADFAIIGALLFGAGILYELLASQVKTKRARLAVGAAVILVVLYVWAELAVGVFTNLGS